MAPLSSYTHLSDGGSAVKVYINNRYVDQASPVQFSIVFKLSNGQSLAVAASWDRATELVLSSPAGTGKATLQLSMSGSALHSVAPWTYYVAPTLTGAKPAGGPLSASTAVTISGTVCGDDDLLGRSLRFFEGRSA